MIILLVSCKLFAEEPRHSLQIGLNYGFMLEYQYAISKNFAIAFSPHFQFIKNSDFVDEYSSLITDKRPKGVSNNIYRFGSNFGLFYRPSGRWLRGTYFGVLLNPMIVYRSYNEQYFFGLGNHFEIGRNWIFNNGLTLSLGGGIFNIIYYPLFNTDYSFLNSIHGDDSYYLEVPITIRVTIGYSFSRHKQ